MANSGSDSGESVPGGHAALPLRRAIGFESDQAVAAVISLRRNGLWSPTVGVRRGGWSCRLDRDGCMVASTSSSPWRTGRRQWLSRRRPPSSSLLLHTHSGPCGGRPSRPGRSVRVPRRTQDAGPRPHPTMMRAAALITHPATSRLGGAPTLRPSPSLTWRWVRRAVSAASQWGWGCSMPCMVLCPSGAVRRGHAARRGRFAAGR